MSSHKLLGLCTFLGLSLTLSLSHAAEPGAPASDAPAATPSEAPASSGGHASGFLVQARMQTQANLASLVGGPGFLLGYQGSSFALGLGASLTRLGASSRKEGETGDDSFTAMLYQVVPTALIDIWQSADGRARANLIVGLGYGKASLSTTNQRQSCTTDAMGNQVCTPVTDQTESSLSMLPLLVGLGGDYFLSPNFALGAEAGLQALIVIDAQSSEDGTQNLADGSGNMELTYGALRATVVLGN